jgi:hypothetical protein
MDKCNISTTEYHPEKQDFAQLSPNGDLSEKSKYQPETISVPPTCSKSSSRSEQKENNLLHEEVAQDTLVSSREPKHWLKKMWKKSKKKSAEKQKVKVLAF